MTTDIPGPVAACVEALARDDVDGLLATLAAGAVVTDEGTAHRGEAAIRAWAERSGRVVGATYDIQGATEVGDETVVAVEITGDLPDSPAVRYFHVTMLGELIAALTIVS